MRLCSDVAESFHGSSRFGYEVPGGTSRTFLVCALQGRPHRVFSHGAARGVIYTRAKISPDAQVRANAWSNPSNAGLLKKPSPRVSLFPLTRGDRGVGF